MVCICKRLVLLQQHRFFQFLVQQRNVLPHRAVLVVIGMKIFILLFLRIGELIILSDRIFQHTLRVIEAAVAVDAAAELVIPAFLLTFREPRFSVIALNVLIHPCQRFLIDDNDLFGIASRCFFFLLFRLF